MSFRRVSLFCFRPFLAIVVSAIGCLSLVAQELAPIPSKADQQNAMKLIEEVFGAEQEEAKTSAARLTLAKKLFETAEDSQNLTNRYLMLTMARDMAAEAGDGQMTLRAVEEIGNSFQVDVFKLKGAALVEASKSATRTHQRKPIAELAFALIDEAIDREDFAAAKFLGKVAYDSARKAKERDLAKQIVVRNEEVAEVKKAHAVAENAFETLKKNPKDAEANLLAGSYLCFVKADWENGLPLVALGGDGQAAKLAIKELAIKEQDGDADVPQQVAIADGWWSLSETKDGVTEEGIRQRAAAWYRTVENEVGSLQKLKIRKRLEGVKAAAKPMTLPGQTKPVVETAAPFAVKSNRGNATPQKVGVNPDSPGPSKLTVTELHRFDDLSSQVVNLDFSPDGRLLASTGLGKTPFLVDVKTGDIVRKFKGHEDDARCVAFSPDGREIATAANDQTVKLWDASTGKLKETFRGHTGQLMDVAFAPNGRTLASSATKEKVIRIWNIEDPSKHSVLSGHKYWVSSVTFSPDGNTLASAGSDGDVRIWNLKTGKTEHVLKGHSKIVRNVRFLSDGKTLFSSGYDKTIRIWDTETGKQLHVINSPTQGYSMDVLRPSERIVAAAGKDELIRFWDIKTEKIVATAEDLPAQIRWAMAGSPDGQLLAVGGQHGNLRIYSVKSQ